MSPFVRALVRGALLSALLLQTYAAWRTTGAYRLHREAVRAEVAGDPATALKRFEELFARRDVPQQTGAYLADAAQAVRLGTTGLDAAERTRLLDLAWSGYAFSVLRCPADSWSWSGLAEIALARAAELDRHRAISLEDLDARAQGRLDPWRAVALGGAGLATRIKPAGYQELDVLASIYQSMGDTTKAAQTYVSSARMMPAPSFHTWGFLTLAPLDLYATIVAAVEEGIGAAPTYEASALHLDFGRFAERNGDLDKALVEFRASRATARNDYQRFYGSFETARLLAARGRLDEAAASLEDARRTGFGEGALRRLHAELSTKQGDDATACIAWFAVVREAPLDTVARIAAAHACERSGEPQLAERVLREGIGRPSETPAIARELVALLVRENRPSAAHDLVRMWRRDDPSSSPWLDTLELPVAALP